MHIVLRIIGVFWVLFTAQDVVAMVKQVLNHGIYVHFSTNNFIYLLMFTGGVGLCILREWARWVLLVGCVALLLLQASHHLGGLKFPFYNLKPLVFYGIFIVLLCLPQSRAVTRK